MVSRIIIIRREVRNARSLRSIIMGARDRGGMVGTRVRKSPMKEEDRGFLVHALFSLHYFIHIIIFTRLFHALVI